MDWILANHIDPTLEIHVGAVEFRSFGDDFWVIDVEAKFFDLLWPIDELFYTTVFLKRHKT